MTPNKQIAPMVGALFLIAIVAYGTGNGLIETLTGSSETLLQVSQNQMQLGIGALLMLLNSVVVVAIGALMFPLLKQQNESIALGYLGARIVEAIILLVGIICLLSLLPISQGYFNAQDAESSYFLTLGALAIKGNFYAYQIAMVILGIGSLFFCYALYQSRLVPYFLSIWGLIGYGVFLLGAILEILGFKVGLLLSVPGGLFELFFGVWLLVKGFNFSEYHFDKTEPLISK